MCESNSRLRGEVGSHRRCDPGEGDSPRIRCSRRQPLTPTLSPQARGEGEGHDFPCFALTAIAAAAVRFSTPSLE
jgi:hypothetical protein